MFTTGKDKMVKLMNQKINDGHPILRMGCGLIIAAALGAVSAGVNIAYADNAVKLKVLVVSTGDIANDAGLAYIKPVLDDMGVPYDVLNAGTTNLTAATLSPSGCSATTVGCVGNYNGTILTNSDLAGQFTTSEWDILHHYETDFRVREAVLSGWPATSSDASGTYLDYGFTNGAAQTAPYNAQWTIPADKSKEVFEYVNTANPLSITDFAFAATPRNDAAGPKDGTVPTVIPLLKTPAGQALVSIIQYKFPGQTIPVREVMFSSISNAWFLIHSQVLATEFVSYATQGVFVGGRKVYMAAHLDDLFLGDEIWDINSNTTDPNPVTNFRLSSADITNAVSKQAAFRAAHPTAGTAFKLDWPFNGSGAVVDPSAATLTANLADTLVSSVVANKAQFRFINHTFTHADMDKPSVPATPPCDYDTFTTVSPIQQEITKNRTVWGLLGLPEQTANNRVLVSGNHSGLKDRKCTDIPELHPGFDVQSDDVAFVAGANPLFFTAAANAGVDYLASDTSQVNQAIEQYAAGVNDGSTTNRLMLPRWPTNVFYNTIDPVQLVDEVNYIFHDRYLAAVPPQDPCTVSGALCTTRTYEQHLAAEADTALRHMLTYRKWPHFFHQTNAYKYDTNGNTLIFDWLNAVYTEYEKLFKLPVINLPYYLIGDNTRDSLTAKSATINATWNRSTNQVTLSANKTVPNLLVTGLQGGNLYGGQFLREIPVNTLPRAVTVNQALAQ